MSRTPTYQAWDNMRSRCRGYDESNIRYYVERGIVVCERWERFENFLADMGMKPSGRRISVDRINNDGSYEPGNCRWATPSIQTRNTRRNVWVEYGGERMILEDACKAMGIKQADVTNRANRQGVTQQQALNAYARKHLRGVGWTHPAPLPTPPAPTLFDFAAFDGVVLTHEGVCDRRE